MTLDEFNKTGIYYGMQMKYRDDKTYYIAGADFEEALYRLSKTLTNDEDEDDSFWVRCENCTVVPD